MNLLQYYSTCFSKARFLFILILGLFYCKGSFAQQAIIYGSITDSIGRPVEAVTIGITGESNGTTSDEHGKYELNAPSEKKITIVYSILELTNWYIAISDTIGKIISSYSVFFNYRIIPVIAVILLSMGIVSWGYCVKANKLIELSFQKNDVKHFCRLVGI